MGNFSKLCNSCCELESKLAGRLKELPLLLAKVGITHF